MEVNIHQAKTHLSRLLQRVAGGEEVIIARAGVPIARLSAVKPEVENRPLGMDRGKIWVESEAQKGSTFAFLLPMDQG